MLMTLKIRSLTTGHITYIERATALDQNHNVDDTKDQVFDYRPHYLHRPLSIRITMLMTLKIRSLTTGHITYIERATALDQNHNVDDTKDQVFDYRPHYLHRELDQNHNVDDTKDQVFDYRPHYLHRESYRSRSESQC